MSKLFLENVLEKFTFSGNYTNHQKIGLIYENLKKSIPVNIQNAVDAIFIPRKNGVVDTEKYCPNIAPPFDIGWFEYKENKKIKGIENMGELMINIGFLIVNIKEKDSAFLHIYYFLFNRESNTHARLVCESQHRYNKKGEWIDFGLDNRNLTGKNVPLFNFHFFKTSITEDDKKIIYETFLWHLLKVFHAISLMHCKNIVKKLSPAIDEALQKARIKHGRLPLKRFYTLEIDAQKTKIEIGGVAKEKQNLMPSHICRGHFKNFDDKPLFGRHKGTYWWPMHVRGSKENGEIIKDYEIKETS